MNALSSDFGVATSEWLVLRCSPSRTLALVAGLRHRGAWTPVWTRRRRLPRSSIFRLVTEPVLPGLAFLPSFNAHDLPAVPRVPYGPMRNVDGSMTRVPDRQMDPLRKIADKPLVPAHQLPKVGTQVRFNAGPFEGIVGRVLSCTIRCAFVQVEGIANPLQVPPTMLGKAK